MADKSIKVSKEDFEYIRVLAREALEGEARKFAREELRDFMKEEAKRLVGSSNFQSVLIHDVKHGLKGTIHDIIYSTINEERKDATTPWSTEGLNKRTADLAISQRVHKVVIDAVNESLKSIELDKRVETTVTNRLNSFKIKATFE